MAKQVTMIVHPNFEAMVYGIKNPHAKGTPCPVCDRPIDDNVCETHARAE